MLILHHQRKIDIFLKKIDFLAFSLWWASLNLVNTSLWFDRCLWVFPPFTNLSFDVTNISLKYTWQFFHIRPFTTNSIRGSNVAGALHKPRPLTAENAIFSFSSGWTATWQYLQQILRTIWRPVEKSGKIRKIEKDLCLFQ